MKLTVTITITSTGEDLDGAVEQLKAQIRDAEAEALAQADAPLDAARRKIEELWPRLGPTLRPVLEAAASFDRPFSSDEWVAALGISGKEFRSKTGNIGRSLKGVNRRLGTDEPKVWDWNGENYFMTPEIRQAIREIQ